MNKVNWKDEIVKMFLIKEEMEKHDLNHLWEYDYPNVAATESEIIQIEKMENIKLDKMYKEFLKCANGWRNFYQTVTLFGTEEMNDSDLLHYANNFLDILEEEGILKESGVGKHDLLPIATTMEDKDLFVILKQGSKDAGMVIWFAGEEIDRFPNFYEYFLTMLDYNRSILDDLKEDEL